MSGNKSLELATNICLAGGRSKIEKKTEKGFVTDGTKFVTEKRKVGEKRDSKHKLSPFM